MKVAIALLSFTLCLLELQSERAEAAKDVVPLQVSIETVREYANSAEFELTISGRNAVPMKLSRFNLVGLLRAGNFAETNRQVWVVRESGVIGDPPSPNIDFDVLIEPRKTNRVHIVTEPIIRFPKNEAASNTNALPLQLQYELSREVGAINSTTGEFSWIICKGRGMTNVKWPVSKR
jgi:hypothetical protein